MVDFWCCCLMMLLLFDDDAAVAVAATVADCTVTHKTVPMFGSFDFMASALHEMLSNHNDFSIVKKPKLLSFDLCNIFFYSLCINKTYYWLKTSGTLGQFCEMFRKNKFYYFMTD
jgi:hypothetical protein